MKSDFRNALLLLTSLCVLFTASKLGAANSLISMHTEAISEYSSVDKTAIEEMTKPDEIIIEEGVARISSHFTRPTLNKLLRQSRKVILTFDDGPHPRTTPQIIEILKRRNLKAVFFVLGIQAQKYPHLVKMIADAGHHIGNHSFSHKNLAQVSQEKLAQELEKTSRLITEITGRPPEFFRPPYGAMNRKVLQKVQQMNMKVLLWTIDPKDWQHKNAASILNSMDRQLGIKNGRLNGGAILLHDIYPSTVQALDPLLDRLAINNYTIAAIDRLESAENSFWAAIDPSIMPPHQIKKAFDLQKTGHKVLINMFEPHKADWTAVSLIRAQKTNTLLQYFIETQ